MKKDNVALLIISIIAIVAMLGYVSYSYIAMGITNDEYNVLATTSNGLVFTAEGGGNFNNNVTDNNMAIPDNNTVVAETNDNMNITLTTDGKKPICCTYDVKWVWDDATDEKNQYKKSANAENEFVLEGQFTTSYNGVSGEAVSISGDGDSNFSKQLPDYKESGSDSETDVLYQGTICNKNGESLNTNVKQAYTLKTKFYNLKEINQDKLKGKTFKGHILITNIKCTKNTEES